ncbi:MAG TPA: hypothetical protein VGM39_01465 [Kofleriaceae bacterium]|jgi:hypothetical protein
MRAWVIAGVLLVGCSGSDDGGDCPAFAKIVSGDIHIDSTALTFALHFEAAPSDLTFDQEAVPANVLEYSWGVQIDTEGDGKFDWEVSLKHFHGDGTPSHVEASPTAGGQANLWEVTPTSGSIAGSATAAATTDGLALGIQSNAAPGIKDITLDGSKFRIETHYQHGSGADYCEDQMDVTP